MGFTLLQDHVHVDSSSQLVRAPEALARTLRRAAPVLVGLALCASPAAAQRRVLGFGDCEKCHKPAIQKWKTDEPAQYGAKAHYNTLKQLSDPKAKGFAAAIGLADPLDAKGRCMGCHGTVVRGRPRTGVSCETCHGPASDYLTAHDKEPWPESYKKSIPLGMRDLHLKPGAIAKLCVDCHVTPERALAAAGHPNGADFDAAAGLQKLVHWTAAFTPNAVEHARYSYGEVGAAAKPLVAKALAGGGAARAAAPPPSAPPLAAGTRPASPASAAAAPWDWDQPVPELPADYPSDADQPPPAPEPGAPAPPPRAARPVAPSVVEDAPFSVDAAPALAPEPVVPAAPTPLTEASALEGRGAELVAKLLEAGVRLPQLRAPAKPREFAGPDAELRHLQDVILYLALETLRRPE